MRQDWNVDDAVNQVMTWIHDGSALPFLKASEDLELKNTYLDRFKDAKARHIDWNKAKDRVLPLAYMVGALATLLAAVDQAKTHGKPERVLPQHAKRAAYLISKVCTYPEDGAICPRWPFPKDCGKQEDNDEIARDFRKIFEKLGLVGV